MKTITKTYSIDENTYKEFERICKKEEISKSKVIVNGINSFLFKNKKFKKGDYFQSLITEDYVTLVEYDYDFITLSNGNRINVTEFFHLYKPIDNTVMYVKEQIKNNNFFENVYNDLEKQKTTEYDETFIKNLKKLDNTLYKIFDTSLIEVKTSDNLITGVNIKIPKNKISRDDLNTIISKYVDINKINLIYFDDKLSSFFNDRNKFQFNVKDIEEKLNEINNKAFTISTIDTLDSYSKLIISVNMFYADDKIMNKLKDFINNDDELLIRKQDINIIKTLKINLNQKITNENSFLTLLMKIKSDVKFENTDEKLIIKTNLMWTSEELNALKQLENIYKGYKPIEIIY